MIAHKRFVLACLTLTLLLSCAREEIALPPGALRGGWVQGKSVLKKDEIDQVVRKAEQGGFKQIFVGVFGDGRTLYPSRHTEQKGGVEPGFDPLVYIVQEAHQRDIQVHAWFAVGRVADAKGHSVVLENHPDWGLTGPDGRVMPWLNFTHPSARQFIADIVMEAVARGVDSVHFDYTRYPGAEWGFDNYSIHAFNAEHDFDLNELRYADLPAYGRFEGNALIRPETAQVLAEFSNGFPAVLLNQYGDGQVLILNWQAGKRTTAAGGEILERGIDDFLEESGRLYILRSERTIAEYGEQPYQSAAGWLEFLGRRAPHVFPDELNELESGSVLVLPYVYLISEDEATQLADFVRSGGHVIFIDAPTRSMDLDEMRALTGMQWVRKYFDEWLLMTPSLDHPLIPTSQRTTEIKIYEDRNGQWFAFRKAGINSLLKDVYFRVKEENPAVLVTITITSDQEQAAQENLQDWQSWLTEGYIDALIPRAYEDTPEALRTTLESWSPIIKAHSQLTYGLIAYVEGDGKASPKKPRDLMTEIKMAISSGSNGFMIFDLDHMTEAQLSVLADF